jgi:hypothetical protein
MARGKNLFCEKLGTWKTSFRTLYCYQFEPREVKR